MTEIRRMTPEEIKRLAQLIYGRKRGWRRKLARDLGLSFSTVEEWARGRREMSLSMSRYVRLHVLHHVVNQDYGGI